MLRRAPERLTRPGTRSLPREGGKLRMRRLCCILDFTEGLEKAWTGMCQPWDGPGFECSSAGIPAPVWNAEASQGLGGKRRMRMLCCFPDFTEASGTGMLLDSGGPALECSWTWNSCPGILSTAWNVAASQEGWRKWSYSSANSRD